MYYIQETDKPSKIFEFFNIIKVQDDKIILPINEKIRSQKRAEKLAMKTKNMLRKSNCNKIIISKKVKEQEQYMNYLYTYNLDIVDGKWLFEVLSDKILDYAVNKKNLEKEDIQLSILVNDLSDIMLEKIKILIKQYKKVNIVTNHIEKFKKIEEQVLSKDGIMITVTNNKKKSIVKSKLILNVDFPEELINKYKIYDEAIIINIKQNVRIKSKRFNGICVNDYEIKFKKELDYDNDKINKYNNKYIYEAQIYKKQPINDIMRKIDKDKVEIAKLIANNVTF